MSFRTVVVTNRCKLSYKNNYLVIRGDEIKLIHLTEINILLVDSTLVSITTYLLCELIKYKIKIIFCDELRNPIGEMVSYYGGHNTSKKIMRQIEWDKNFKQVVWTKIVNQKITNQRNLLKELEKEEYKKLQNYIDEIEFNDVTNREGHSAKVYFNSLFGKGFCRDDSNDINAALNYGYSIILSTFNKEIVSNGYLTQLGIKHKNEFNYFNLSCDLMEPFRILVDKKVFDNKDMCFDGVYKMELVDILNQKVFDDGKEYYLTNVIQLYVKSIFNAIEDKTTENLLLFAYI